MFIEISMIQKFRTVYSQSILATSSTIALFLAVGGLGSYFAKRLLESFRRFYQLLFLLLVSFGFLVLSGVLNEIVFLIPLAFLMGFPFVLGVQTIGETTSQFISWAWAINGTASVVGAILAQLFNTHFGFQSVFVFSLLLYAIAGALFYFIQQATSQAQSKIH
jgi:predicted MFS family arabinose efflux permease